MIMGDQTRIHQEHFNICPGIDVSGSVQEQNNWNPPCSIGNASSCHMKISSNWHIFYSLPKEKKKIKKSERNLPPGTLLFLRISTPLRPSFVLVIPMLKKISWVPSNLRFLTFYFWCIFHLGVWVSWGFDSLLLDVDPTNKKSNKSQKLAGINQHQFLIAAWKTISHLQ